MDTRRVIVACLLFAGACIQSPTIPKLSNNSFELQISQSVTELAPGGSDTITVTAYNHKSVQARLFFSSTCQILAYILDQRSEPVVPPHGEFPCVPVASQLIIQADSSVSQTFVWKGDTMFDPPGSGTRLPAGDYFIVASMNAPGLSVPGFAVRVKLLP